MHPLFNMDSTPYSDQAPPYSSLEPPYSDLECDTPPTTPYSDAETLIDVASHSPDEKHASPASDPPHPNVQVDTHITVHEISNAYHSTLLHTLSFLLGVYLLLTLYAFYLEAQLANQAPLAEWAPKAPGYIYNVLASKEREMGVARIEFEGFGSVAGRFWVDLKVLALDGVVGREGVRVVGVGGN